MQFQTDYRYTDRETKARYVWLKYQSVLEDASILDVGADECHLRSHLAPGGKYLGVGKGGSPDREVDLERELLPFDDSSFDCVVCFDVLEHLDNPHAVFDELCRVSRRYVIISLPNCWSSLWGALNSGRYRQDQTLKFYGLPPEPPPDRHKWFFSAREARKFITARTGANGMRIVQMDSTRRALRLGMRLRTFWLHSDVDPRDLYEGPVWALLEHPDLRCS